MADKKENSNKDDGSRNNDPLKAMNLLLNWYNVAKDEERSLGSRKVELSAYSLVGLSIIVSIIGYCFSKDTDLINKILGNLWFLIVFIFILFLMFTLFFLIALYIFFLNKYQRIYFVISDDLEKIINDYISGNDIDKIINNLTSLSPILRFRKSVDLDKGKHIFEKWYKHSLDYSYYPEFKSLAPRRK